MAKIYIEQNGQWIDICDCQFEDGNAWLDKDSGTIWVYDPTTDTWYSADCGDAIEPCGTSIAASGGASPFPDPIIKEFDLGDLGFFTGGGYVNIEYDAANIPDRFVFRIEDKNDPAKFIERDIGYVGDPNDGGNPPSGNDITGFGFGCESMFFPPIGWGDSKLIAKIYGPDSGTGWFLRVNCPYAGTIRTSNITFVREQNASGRTNQFHVDDFSVSNSGIIGNNDYWTFVNPSRDIVGSDFYVPYYTQSTQVPNWTSLATFELDEVVLAPDGKYYKCIVSSTTGIEPGPGSSGTWQVCVYGGFPDGAATDPRDHSKEGIWWPNKKDNSGIDIEANRHIILDVSSPQAFPGVTHVEVEFYNKNTSIVDHTMSFEGNPGKQITPFSLDSGDEYELRFKLVASI